LKIDHQRIVLTGAASGIGEAIMRRLAAEEVDLMAVDIQAERLQQAVAALPPHRSRIQCFTGDLSQPETVDRLLEAAAEKLGGVDIFIANAGFAYYEKLAQPDWQHIESIYRLNVFSPIYTLEKLRVFQAGQPFRMVVVASAMAYMSVPGYALYASTKAALHRFVEGVRFELDRPDQVMVVYPIATRTNFFNAASQKTPVPWPSQTPDEVARAVLDGLRRDRREVYPSLIFRSILWLDRILPFVHVHYQRKEQHQFDRWQKNA